MVQDVNPQPTTPNPPRTLPDELLLERFRNVCQKQQFFGDLRRDYLTLFFKVLALSVTAGAALVTASSSLDIDRATASVALRILASVVNVTGALAILQMIQLERKVFGYREAESEIANAYPALPATPGGPAPPSCPVPDKCEFRGWAIGNGLLVLVPAVVIWLGFARLDDMVPIVERYGLVNFESTPNGRIMIDDAYYGRTPAHGLRVPAGERDVVITAPGHSARPVQLRVTEGSIQTHSVILTEDKK